MLEIKELIALIKEQKLVEVQAFVANARAEYNALPHHHVAEVFQALTQNIPVALHDTYLAQLWDKLHICPFSVSLK